MAGYYIPNTKEAWWFVLSIANTAAPTAAEITAGTALTADLRAVNGFATDPQTTNVPTMAGGFAPVLSGAQQGQASSLTFAEQNTYASNTIEAALTPGASGTDGYIVRSRFTKTAPATTKVDVFPVTIPPGGLNRPSTVDNAPAEFTVSFSLTAPPVYPATVAA